MELSQFASAILRGDRWEDKLVSSPEGFQDSSPGAPLTVIPRFPGRPENLRRFGRSDFPKVETLADDAARGRLLHFFANHELLAMELMALTLLKFPDTEQGFRLGLARTIVEEQKHLRMYVARMRELGIDFGELPTSDYFWNALKDGASPLEFVVQMSLTLEQANLDFSFYYQRAVEAVGDSKTASLLETVYQEEIGHVKHGVAWFNTWRKQGNPPDGEDDWDAYLRLLPLPMNPRRAKGPVFCSAARRTAGLSERYISEMEVYSGSKGRPASYWFFNPLCEAEIARGKTGFTGSKTVQSLSLDLEIVPAFLALETDVVLVRELPRAAWLKTLKLAGLRLPEFRKVKAAGENFPERNIAGLEPWGWSPDAFELFRSAAPKLIHATGSNGDWSRAVLAKSEFGETNLGPLFSKNWSLNFYRAWMEKHPEDAAIFGPGVDFVAELGRSFSDWTAARQYLEGSLARAQVILAKAPWGTSGSMNKRVLNAEELDTNLGRWIQNIISTHGSIVLEPWLEKVADLSLQIEVGEKSKVLGVRRFLNGRRLEYRGTYLGTKLGSLSAEQNRFLHAATSQKSPLARWEEMGEAIGAALYAGGYRGNAGVDGMLATSGGQLFLRPIVEVNPRWTMGRVAIELEKNVLPGTPAAWLFLSATTLEAQGLPASFAEAAREIANRFPLKKESKGGREWISEGVLFTNDPETAREVLTVLVVGARGITQLTTY